MEGLLKSVWVRIPDGPRDEMGTMKTAETPYEHRGVLKPPLAGVTKTILCVRTRPSGGTGTATRSSRERVCRVRTLPGYLFVWTPL